MSEMYFKEPSDRKVTRFDFLVLCFWSAIIKDLKLFLDSARASNLEESPLPYMMKS